MKLFITFLTLTSQALIANSLKLPFKHVEISYNNGLKYSVQYGEQELTWVGLAGDDLGISQTNPYSIHQDGDYKYLIRWIEKENIVVHSEINLISNTVLSSIFIPNHNYKKSYFYPFLKGSLKILK